jgi:Ca2+-binding RTX toxin-like protein
VLVAQRYNYDGGGYLNVQFDTTNAYVWSNSQSRYDAGGMLVAQRYNYDGGGYLDIQFDTTNAHAWSNSQFRYDAGGMLVAQRYNYDDGGYLNVQFDTTNAYAWSENQLRYDASGASLVQWLRYDDGSDTIFTNLSYVLPANDQIELLRTYGSAGTMAINLTGNAFANTIVGNKGANVLDGKGGGDLLHGDGGGDTFAFTSALGAGNVDTIGDFQPGLDRIALDDGVFGGLPLGALAPGAFSTGTAAQDADDRILYDPGTGALYFDPDGIGGVGGVQFATLNAAPLAGDFLVI